MVSASNANFKVGFAGADPRLFDLLIDLSNEFVIPLKSVLLDSKAKSELIIWKILVP